MHMTSLFKSSLNGLSGSSGEAVAEGARRATGETVSPEAAHRDPEGVGHLPQMEAIDRCATDYIAFRQLI
jgi:hypothetical protein